jgi:ankyrin repeat protein
MNEYNTKLFELFQKRAATEDIIKFIEENKNDLDLECENEKGMHLMHLATLRNDLILVRFLLSSLKLNPDIISDKGFTALHMASQRGSVEIVQELLEHKADINCQLLSMGNATPLMLAVQKKQKDVVKVLSEHPSINLQIEFANTSYNAMQIAISSSHDHDPVWLEIVKTLHEAGISILPAFYAAEDKTIVKMDSMYIAISVFNPKMVALLLELGYKNTIKLEEGSKTASSNSSLMAIIKLIKAAKNESYIELLMIRDIIELLAKSENVDINCIDHIGRTPIMIAFSLGSVGISSVINIIESGRCDINIKNSDGFTIIEQIKNFLNNASETEIGNLSLTEIEVSKILDFIFPGDSEEKLLMQKKLAPLSGNYFLQSGENVIDRIEEILVLLNQGAKFHIDEKNRQISKQRLEEHLAAYLNNATLEELEYKTESGFTLLQVVIFHDFHNITKFLLGKGVAITTATNGGNTPLHYAMLEHISGINLDLLTEYIIKNNLHLVSGENIFNIVNDYKENILHIACKTQIMKLNQFAKIKSILNAGFVDIDAEDMNGLRVIDIAIMNHNNNLVSEILTHEPNLCGNAVQGSTPLHYAASVGNLYIYKLLAGKFPEALKIEDYEGRTPLHHAAQNLHLDIIKTLAPNDYDILKIRDYSRGYTVLHEFIENVQDLDDPEYWEDVSAAFNDPTLLEYLMIII